jgi:hypothetical protein
MPAYRGFLPTTGHAENRLFSLARQTLYPHTPENPAAKQAVAVAKRMLDVMDVYSEQRGRLAIVRTADVVVQKFAYESGLVSLELLSVKGLGRLSQQIGGEQLSIKVVNHYGGYSFSRLQRPGENGLLRFDIQGYSLSELQNLAEVMADEVDYHEQELGYPLPIGSGLGPQ